MKVWQGKGRCFYRRQSCRWFHRFRAFVCGEVILLSRRCQCFQPQKVLACPTATFLHSAEVGETLLLAGERKWMAAPILRIAPPAEEVCHRLLFSSFTLCPSALACPGRVACQKRRASGRYWGWYCGDLWNMYWDRKTRTILSSRYVFFDETVFRWFYFMRFFCLWRCGKSSALMKTLFTTIFGSVWYIFESKNLRM